MATGEAATTEELDTALELRMKLRMAIVPFGRVPDTRNG
jgi:hypothetical protein